MDKTKKKDMKEGDLITTYYAGFFRLKRIERRFYTEYDLQFTSKDKVLVAEYSPLYHFEQEYDSNGNVKTSKEKACDSAFCKPAEEKIREEIGKVEKLKLILKTII